MKDLDFKKGLEQHGYPFQYRVLAECLDLHDKRRTNWKLLVNEFPVEAGGRDTKIDFVLTKSVSSNVATEDRYIVAECKRVNPAFGDWCFVRAPYWHPRFLTSQVVIETTRSDDHKSGGFGTTSHLDIFNVAFEMKSGEKGDSHPVSNDRDAIEKACTQVCRGLNGFLGSVMKDREMNKDPGVSVLPVVFTTARLWTGNTSLERSDLETGEVEVTDLRQLDLLFYQYVLSASMKHDLARGRLDSDQFQECYARDYVRSVVVVGPTGIEKLFQEDWFPGFIGGPQF